MKTFWSFNGSGNNAKKILENQLLRTQYCIPLDDYKKDQGQHRTINAPLP